MFAIDRRTEIKWKFCLVLSKISLISIFNQIIAHNSFSKQKNLSVAQFLREIFDMLVVILTLALE